MSKAGLRIVDTMYLDVDLLDLQQQWDDLLDKRRFARNFSAS